MAKILYCKAEKMDDEDIPFYTGRLPEVMQAEIDRYRNSVDKKTKLLSRLMLLQSLVDTGNLELIYKWRRDSYNRPVIDNWFSFSISHSSEMATFCCDKNVVGIDVEKRVDINYKELMPVFHNAEQEYIRQAPDGQKAFFDVWVRKEAVLKAIGIGIVQGLNGFNSLDNEVSYLNEKYYLTEVSLHNEYTCFLCSKNASVEVSCEEFIFKSVL